jgi:hypothetical protein
MTSRQPSRIAFFLLERLVPDNEPLTGDLREESRERPATWLWRQVLFAVLGHAIVRVRTSPRMTTEGILIATALLALLGFQAVVGATLMNHLLVLSDPAWSHTGQYQAWQRYAIIPSLAVAVLTGRVIGRLHRTHRVAAVLALSMSATIAASLNLMLFVPNVFLQPFLPQAGVQTLVATVFIAALFAGIGSRSTCESQPSA